MQFSGIRYLGCHFLLPFSFLIFSLPSPSFLHQKEFLTIQTPEKVEDKHFDLFISSLGRQKTKKLYIFLFGFAFDKTKIIRKITLVLS